MTKEERREKYTAIARQRRDAKHEREKSRRVTCFKCRQHGHAASSCPSSSEKEHLLCYKCGSTEHTLSKCPKVRKGQRVVEMKLPFATCFVCHQKGHLASQCEQNERGVYVNGGSCRICGSTRHLSTDCPENRKYKEKKKTEPTEQEEAMANEGLLHGKGDEQPEGQEKEAAAQAQPKKRRVVKF